MQLIYLNLLLLARSCIASNALSSFTFSSGKFIDAGSTESRPDSHQQPDEGRDNEESDSKLYHCPKDGCVNEFQLHRNLEYHMLYGKCTMKEERYTLLDKAKLSYRKKLIEGCSAQPNLASEITGVISAQHPKLPRGWALKTTKKRGRFNNNQRQYLDDKFRIGRQTGNRADPEQVFIDMRLAKNDDGRRRFTVDEFLSAQQIKSYFSMDYCQGKECWCWSRSDDRGSAVFQHKGIHYQWLPTCASNNLWYP